jgi:glycosyltransferase involved in cell wall biosynthesis
MRILHLTNDVRDIGNGIINAAVDLACEQSRQGADVLFGSAGGDYEELLRNHGVEHVALQQRSDVTSLPRMVWRLRQLFGERDVDVVHAHMVTGALAARVARTRTRVALVTTVHNEWQWHAPLMGLADRVVAVSEANVASLARRGIPRARMSVVRNGPLGSCRQVAPVQPVILDRPSVVTVAGMFHRKGIADLIAAFEMVSPDCPGTLYVVGDGPDRGEFEGLVAASPARERIRFTGFQPRPDRYLRAADVFVLASRREPFGLVLAEAREAGCAIVATAVGGIPEALDGGRAGCLVPPSDPPALAAVLRRLLTDDARRHEVAASAREGLEWLSVARVAREYESVYASARASRRRDVQ